MKNITQMRKSIIPLVIVLQPLCMNAQFVVEKNDDTKATINGNVRFEQGSDNSWSIGGTNLSEVKSLSRDKRQGAIEMDREGIVDGMALSEYFGDRYEDTKGLADYYIVLSNDDLGGLVTDEWGQNIPAHQGGYGLWLDIYGPLSADHSNAIIPEGTYAASANKGQFVVNTELSWACLNSDGTYGGLKEIFFKSGSVTVTHTDAENGYDISGSFTNEDGSTFSFHYNGSVHFVDLTGIEDEEDDDYLHEDMVINPVVVKNYNMTYLSKPQYDEHRLRLFTVTELTEDGQHCNAPGIKLEIEYLTAKDGTIAGTYTIGKMNGWSPVNPQPGYIYPGLYMGTVVSNTFVEKVTDDYAVKTAIATDGTMTITDNGDGTYTVDVDFVITTPSSSATNSVKCTWTGPLETTDR